MQIDMTEGNAARHLIAFAIPIVLGNMFQLTYNAVDSIIVSRAAGTAALAAVGTAAPVMNIIILGVSGLTIGASVLISRAFGAHETEEIKKAFSSLIVLGLVFSGTVALLAILGTKAFLRLLKVPQEILPAASSYLRLILIGTVFTYLYNAYTAAMRAIGDSTTPVRYLMIASLVNIALDLIFIAVFRWGVTGAALATVLSQALSALLCIRFNQKGETLLHLHRTSFHPDKETMKETISLGAVTALQQSCQPVGKLLIQGVINTLGVGTIAVFDAVSKIEQFALIPEQSISHALMTFTGQNRGARDKKRIKEGIFTGLSLELCYAFFILIALKLLKTPLVALFLTDHSLVRLGAEYLSLMAAFYFFSGLTNGIQGFFRGMARMGYTVLGTMIQITFRVIFTFVLVPRLGLFGLAYATAIGWLCMIICHYPLAYITYKRIKF